MSASPEFTQEPILEGDDAVRTLMSALLSGAYSASSCLDYVGSLCQARPEAGAKLVALLDRYRNLGRISAAQYQTVTAKIEQVLAALKQPDLQAIGAMPAPRRAAADSAAQAAAVSISASAIARSSAKRADTWAADRRSTRVDDHPSTHGEIDAETTQDLAQFLAQVSQRSTAHSASPSGPYPQHAIAAAAPTAPSSSFLPPQLDRAAPGPGARDLDLSAIAAPAALLSIAPSQAISTGMLLGKRYELQVLLGHGGRGSVYQGLDRIRSRLGIEPCNVAIKIVSNHPTRPDIAALGREFQDAQRLSHPNVINVYDLDCDDNCAFYTMELLDGEQLSQILKQVDGPLQRQHALALIYNIGAAVAHAHSRGVVHTDLKPHNIMITRNGQLRVLDFGGVSAAAREPWIAELWVDSQYRPTTPAYASCQQLEGASADPRDDIYALACIAYQLLTGRHPFNQLSSRDARARRLRARRPGGLSAKGWRALRRGLAWEREQRPASVDAWLTQLDLPAAAKALPPLEQLTAANTARWHTRYVPLGAALLVGFVLMLLAWQYRDVGGRDRLALLHSLAHRDAARSAAPPDSATVSPAPTVSDAAPVSRDSASAIAPAAPNPANTAASALPAATAAAGAHAAAVLAPMAPAHPAFAASSYDVPVGDPAARIVIRRLGNTQTELSFVWWTEDNSARADVDYASLGHTTEKMAAGEDAITVFVPIISNSLRSRPVQFDVVLAAATTQPDVASARATVTIEATDNGG